MGGCKLSANFFCACLSWLATGRDSVAALMEVQPRYMLLGGVIGAGITWTVIKSVDALGPARSALFIVVSQLAVAYLISLSGMFGMEKEPFSWEKTDWIVDRSRWNCSFPMGNRKFCGYCNKSVTKR